MEGGTTSRLAQKLEPRYTHNKQHPQKSHALWVAIQMKGTEPYFPWYC